MCFTGNEYHRNGQARSYLPGSELLGFVDNVYTTSLPQRRRSLSPILSGADSMIGFSIMSIIIDGIKMFRMLHYTPKLWSGHCFDQGQNRSLVCATERRRKPHELWSRCRDEASKRRPPQFRRNPLVCTKKRLFGTYDSNRRGRVVDRVKPWTALRTTIEV